MAKYIIRFMPEYCATSLWAGNDEARAAFGSPIEYSDVHLPEELIRRLEDFDDRVMGIIDWSEPNGPSPMTKEEQLQLYHDGQELIAHVREVLGPDFEVLNELDWIYPSDDE